MNQNPTAADEVHSLLAVMADPAKHKARLDELLAQQKATDERIAALTEMADRTQRENSAAQAQTIVLNNRKTALDARESEIEQRAKQLDVATSAQKKSEQDADKKLKAREAAVTARENAVEQREADLKEMEAETRAALDKATSLKEKAQRQAAAIQAAVAQ